MDLLVVLTEWFCSKLLTFRTATQIVKSGQKFRTDFKMLTVLKVRTLDGSHLVSTTRRSIATFHLNFVSIR